MKKVYILLSLGLSLSIGINAQDCSGNRYFNEVFPSVTEIKDVEYGRNFLQDGVTEKVLQLDIYLPQGDLDTDRPLVVFAHGGSFISGTRADMAGQCRSFAKLGYVAASISYRLLDINDPAVFANPGLEFEKEVMRAMHDMRAAVRFFRKSVADNGNPYGINSNIIIVGGGSAGAILANHVAYLDTPAKIPADVTTYVAAQGGLEGNTGNAGFSSVPQMVVSLCGAIGDTMWIEAGDQPIVGVHNITDNVVPNVSGYPNVSGFSIPVMLYGDSAIHIRATNNNMNSAYMSVPTSGHCVFPPTAAIFVKNFMHSQICIQQLAIEQEPSAVLFSVYPNPLTDNYFNVDVPSNSQDIAVSVIDMMGKVVVNMLLPANQNLLTVNTEMFAAGLYTVKLSSQNGLEASKKIIVR
jgi:para-nitrobenzyl esterase